MGIDYRSRSWTAVFAVLVVLSAVGRPGAAETVLGFTQPRAHANLGVSVDADGDRIVAGAPGYGVSAVEGGAVVVFQRSSSEWILDRIVEPASPEEWGRFGFAVGVSGSILVAGAPGWDDAGAAFIFDLSGQHEETTTLNPDDVPSGGRFGESVAIDGDTIAVGAPQAGRVYIYSESDTGLWQLSTTLISNQVGEGFGASVSLAGTHLAVGIDESTIGGVASGAVALYEKTERGWTETQVLRADVQIEGSLFGRAVDIEGDVLVVGAPSYRRVGSATGAAFVFRHNLTSAQWDPEQVIGATEATLNSLFGLDVAIRDGRITIGAPGDSASDVRGGTVWQYHRNEPLWVLDSRFEATTVSAGDHLGRSVASLAGLAIVGVPSDDVMDRASGSVLVFEPVDRRARSFRRGNGRSRRLQWGYDSAVGSDKSISGSTAMCSFDTWPPDDLSPEFFNICVKELNPRFPAFDDLMDVLVQSWARGVGTKVHWEYLEREQGTIDWVAADALLASFSSSGLDPLVTVRGVPRWASSSPGEEQYWLYPPALMADWQTFVQALVSRYGSQGTDQVHRWEIWNEPNLDDFFVGSVDDYIEILNAAYTSIKEIESGAEVWAPTLTFHPWAGDEVWTFLDRVLAEGLFDVLSVHLYFSTPDEFHSVLVEIRQRLTAAGLPEIPIAVTEANTVESVTNCREFSDEDETIHADELDQVLRCAAAAGAEYVFWFKSTDRGMYCSPPWDNTRTRNGLVGDGWSGKAEYGAFQSLAASVGAVFSDGFESGDTSAWISAAAGGAKSTPPLSSRSH